MSNRGNVIWTRTKRRQPLERILTRILLNKSLCFPIFPFNCSTHSEIPISSSQFPTDLWRYGRKETEKESYISSCQWDTILWSRSKTSPLLVSVRLLTLICMKLHSSISMSNAQSQSPKSPNTKIQILLLLTHKSLHSHSQLAPPTTLQKFTYYSYLPEDIQNTRYIISPILNSQFSTKVHHPSIHLSLSHVSLSLLLFPFHSSQISIGTNWWNIGRCINVVTQQPAQRGTALQFPFPTSLHQTP